jgi:hypothetical protein
MSSGKRRLSTEDAPHPPDAPVPGAPRLDDEGGGGRDAPAGGRPAGQPKTKKPRVLVSAARVLPLQQRA